MFAKLFSDKKFLPLAKEKKLVKPSQVLLDGDTFPEVQELSPHFVTVDNLHGQLTRRSEELRSLGAKDEVTLEVVNSVLSRYERGQDIDEDERERILVKTCLQESMSSKHVPRRARAKEWSLGCVNSRPETGFTQPRAPPISPSLVQPKNQLTFANKHYLTCNKE